MKKKKSYLSKEAGRENWERVAPNIGKKMETGQRKLICGWGKEWDLVCEGRKAKSVTWAP